MSKNIALIRFSSRDLGNCAAIAQFLSDYHKDDAVLNFKVDNNVVTPCSDCNYQCLQPGAKCPNVTETQIQVMDAICQADLVYFMIPNYCGFPPASYYAFNEKSVGYFNKNRELMGKYRTVAKKFIVVSNTEGQNFESAIRSQVMGDPEMIYLKTGKYKKQSTAGDLMESEEAKADLLAFLDKETFV